MTAKIKLNAASGGGSISIQAPSSSSNNRVISLPDIADGTLVTSQSTLDATKLSGNLPAISGASLTGLSSGLAMADQWRITSDFTISSYGNTIAANWERADTGGFGQIGTGMTESSGVFTFPSTGIYLVCHGFTAIRYSTRLLNAIGRIHATTDGSNYSVCCSAIASCVDPGNFASYGCGQLLHVMDVTNTSTHKVYFSASAPDTVKWDGHSDQNGTYGTFLKIGDT